MSKCDITVTTHQNNTEYRVGDRVSGEVTVQVNSNCLCRGLKLFLRGQTHGRGNRRSIDTFEMELFEGEWQSGQRHVYPFELTIPDGPPTYHGSYLNLTWSLLATADIPWAFDPEGQLEIELAVGPNGYRDERGVQNLSAAPQWLGAVFLIFFGLVFGLVPIFPMAFALYDLYMQESGDWIFVLLSVIPFAGIWYLMLFFSLLRNKLIKRFLAARLIGEVRLVETSEAMRPGQTESIAVSLIPKRLSGIRKVTASLVGQEIVTSGSGTNRRTYRNTIHSEKLRLTDPPDIRVGYEVLYTGELTIPKDASPSFTLPDNRLEWSVDIEVDIARWFDWAESRRLLIYAPSDQEESM